MEWCDVSAVVHTLVTEFRTRPARRAPDRHGAAVALSSADDRHQALREVMTDLLGMDEPRRRIAAMLSGLDIRYDLGEGHPLLGRRMPDLDVQTADGWFGAATVHL